MDDYRLFLQRPVVPGSGSLDTRHRTAQQDEAASFHRFLLTDRPASPSPMIETPPKLLLLLTPSCFRTLPPDKGRYSIQFEYRRIHYRLVDLFLVSQRSIHAHRRSQRLSLHLRFELYKYSMDQRDKEHGPRTQGWRSGPKSASATATATLTLHIMGITFGPRDVKRSRETRGDWVHDTARSSRKGQCGPCKACQRLAVAVTVGGSVGNVGRFMCFMTG